MVDEAGMTVDPAMGLKVLREAKEAIYRAFEGQGDSPASAVSTAITGYMNAMQRIAELERARDYWIIDGNDKARREAFERTREAAIELTRTPGAIRALKFEDVFPQQEASDG
jgi:hypothetical protein